MHINLVAFKKCISGQLANCLVIINVEQGVQVQHCFSILFALLCWDVTVHQVLSANYYPQTTM